MTITDEKRVVFIYVRQTYAILNTFEEPSTGVVFHHYLGRRNPMAFTPPKFQSVAGAIIRIFGAIGLALTLLMVAAYMVRPAEAQTVCVAHADLIQQLSLKFAEEPMALGLGSDGSVMQLFTSKDGETWTLVRITTDGTSCMMAGGKSWIEMSPRAAGRIS